MQRCTKDAKEGSSCGGQAGYQCMYQYGFRHAAWAYLAPVFYGIALMATELLEYLMWLFVSGGNAKVAAAKMAAFKTATPGIPITESLAIITASPFIAFTNVVGMKHKLHCLPTPCAY